MQKKRYFTGLILIILVLYFLFSQFYLKDFGNTYVYIINPMFFIILAILLKIIIPRIYKFDKYKKTIIQYVLITVFIYILIYLLSGLFLTYGKNPYSLTFKGLLLNIYSIGTIIFAREFIRYKLINSVPKKDKKIFFILIVIVFAMQDFPIKSIIENFNFYYIFKIIFAIIVPSIAKNYLFTYIQMYTDYVPTVAYEMFINFIMIISPVLPNTTWILETTIPIMLLIYCMYEVSSKDNEHRFRKIQSVKPKGLIPWTIIIVLVIWFALGIFPIKPVGIATGSMEPNLNIGDAAIIMKCDASIIKENDIIEYQKDNYTIIHRVIKIYNRNGKIFFITKGDNNDDEDRLPVTTDEVKGRIIARIPYIAFPSIFMKNLTTNKLNVDVELGK